MTILIFVALWMLFSLMFMLIYKPSEGADMVEQTIIVVLCFPWVIIGAIKIYLKNKRGRK